MAAVPAPYIAPAPPAPEPAAQDSLREQLVRYVTKGHHAVHTTNAELDRMIEAAVNQPGGRAYLESLSYVEESSQDTTLWSKQEQVIGTIELTKINATLSLHVPALEKQFTGHVHALFVPNAELLRNGILSYDDESAFKDGNIDIKIEVCGVDLRVDFVRNGDRVANITFSPAGLYMHQGHSLPGTGTWSVRQRHQHESEAAIQPTFGVGVAA